MGCAVTVQDAEARPLSGLVEVTVDAEVILLEPAQVKRRLHRLSPAGRAWAESFLTRGSITVTCDTAGNDPARAEVLRVAGRRKAGQAKFDLVLRPLDSVDPEAVLPKMWGHLFREPLPFAPGPPRSSG
jgi:hypothetical protein